ncbi:MAG: recombination protein RmuC [Campylobacterota bacterium]|nr:recombination protein RmuC [Campylobacterota bacterium]
MVEVVYVIFGIFAGALGAWVIIVNSLKNELKNEVEKSNALLNQNSVLNEKINGLNEKFEAQISFERNANREKIELLEKNKEQMKLEFKEIASKILESNSQKFSTQNQESINRIIAPIKEQFNEFKKQIDDVYIKEAKDRSMLQAEIKSIKEINHQMSKDARNLTNALKGESKKQGIWGEMILESVLENSGLRLGIEYEREVSLEHESDASRYRPDVVVHLPDARDIIIDAKTSLSAYEKYVSCEDDAQKETFAKEHLFSMRNHIKTLAQKDYANLKGIKTLDFIFMFVPIESALLMAMEYDSSLFDEAFKKSVILVGPTTLMVSLRAVENTWRYEHQQKNAQEIAKRAGLLYDKFSSFIDSVERLGKQLATVQKTYDETFSKMHTGAGSITSQFQKLESLGAAANKSLPEHILKKIES